MEAEYAWVVEGAGVWWRRPFFIISVHREGVLVDTYSQGPQADPSAAMY